MNKDKEYNVGDKVFQKSVVFNDITFRLSESMGRFNTITGIHEDNSGFTYQLYVNCEYMSGDKLIPYKEYVKYGMSVLADLYSKFQEKAEEFNNTII